MNMRTWHFLGFAAALAACGTVRPTAQTSKIQNGVVNANGSKLAYERVISPKNEAILLIAGTNSQFTMWPASFCDHLARRDYPVIRSDNCDVGLTTKLAKAGLPDWAAIGQALQAIRVPQLLYTLDDMVRGGHINLIFFAVAENGVAAQAAKDVSLGSDFNC